MRKTVGVILASALIAAATLVVGSPVAAQQPRAAGGTVSSFYDLKTMALDGKPGDLTQYKGKVSLVVNVASKCGFTPQYEGLEKLQREMKGKGFNVLGFPSNDFGGQEPGTAQEIATFCRLTYDVTFPMFEKVVTRKGAGQSPVYAFLGSSGNLPAWNFAKYVVDKQGRITAFFESKVTPEHPDLPPGAGPASRRRDRGQDAEDDPAAEGRRGLLLDRDPARRPRRLPDQRRDREPVQVQDPAPQLRPPPDAPLHDARHQGRRFGRHSRKHRHRPGRSRPMIFAPDET